MFELNPDQARRYIQAWINRGELVEGNCRLDDATDEDLVRVAKQLFLYCDEKCLHEGELH
jgi:hypothetical protein